MKGDSSCHIYSEAGKRRHEEMLWDSTVMVCDKCKTLTTWENARAREENNGRCKCGCALSIEVAEEPFEFGHGFWA